MNNHTIWKQQIALTDVQTISVPKGAQMLHVAEQFGEICLWFKCDPSQSIEKRQIAIVGTGHPAPGDEARHVGTLITRGGALVWHVFERDKT